MMTNGSRGSGTPQAEDLTERRCKNCNAPLDMSTAKNGVVTCAFCQGKVTLPKAGQCDDVTRLIDAGQTALEQCRFDDALESFGKAVELDGTEPEAYWGRALARHKVQYLKDTVNNCLQPICHDIRGDAFSADRDYDKALSLSSPEQRAIYEKRAAEIDKIRREFAEFDKKKLRYDCFICVKVTDVEASPGTEKHTEDYAAAYRLYNALKKSGFKPFFSEEEMGNRTGADYEALILYALKVSPCMLVVCSDESYLETKWVKNEYTRFVAMIADEEKERDSVTIVYRGKPIERLPGIRGKIQGVDYNNFDALERIRNFVSAHDVNRKLRLAEQAAAEKARKVQEAAEQAEAARKVREAAIQAAKEQKARAAAERAETKKKARAAAAQAAEARKTRRAAEKARKAQETVNRRKNVISVLSLIALAAGLGLLTYMEIAIVGWIRRPLWLALWLTAVVVSIGAFVLGIVKGRRRCVQWWLWIPAGLLAVAIPVVRSMDLFSRFTWFPIAFYATAGVVAVVTIFVCIKCGVLRCARTVSIALAIILAPLIGISAAEQLPFFKYDGYESGFFYILDDDGTASLTLCEQRSRLSVPSSVRDVPVSSLDIDGTDAEDWSNDTIRSIEFCDGFETLPELRFAWSGCTALTSLTLPDTITQVDCGALLGCGALTNISLPFVGEMRDDTENNFFGYIFGAGTAEDNDRYVPVSLRLVTVTDASYIAEQAFSGCRNLSNISVLNGVSHIGKNAFSGCYNLTNLSLPFVGERADGTGYTHFGYIFGAEDYTQNTYSVLSSLQNVTITGGASIDAYAFSGCSSLKRLTIPDDVISIGFGAFSGCNGLERIVIPFIGATRDGTDNLHFGYLFGAETAEANGNHVPAALTTVVVSDGIRIGAYAFSGCENLTGIHLSDGLTEIGDGAFDQCDSLADISVPDSVINIGNGVFDETAYFADEENWDNNTLYIGSHLIKVRADAIASGTYTVRNGTITVAGGAFAGLDTLSEVVIPDSVVSVGASAFAGCEQLLKIGFGSGLRRIGDGAFRQCVRLSEISVPTGTTHIGAYAFANCTALSRIYMPDSVTNIGKDAFLQSAYFRNEMNRENGTLYIGRYLIKVDSVPDGEYKIKEGTTVIAAEAFAGCGDALTAVTIPESVTHIGERAFVDCRQLREITIPDSVTDIGAGAFGGCSAITTVTLGRRVQNIGAGAFADCGAIAEIRYRSDIAGWCAIDGLENLAGAGRALYIGETAITGEVVIPEGVTEIGEYAFAYCAGITKVVIPVSVRTIGGNAFLECHALTEVQYAGTEADWEAIDIGSGNESLEAAIQFEENEEETGETDNEMPQDSDVDITDTE